MTEVAGEQGQPAADQREFERVLHELQLHQTELEMQNQELRRAQQMLEESRARYADLYDLAPVGYCTLDEQANVVEVNLTGASLLGVERESLVGKTLPALLRAHDAASLRAMVERCFAGEAGRVVIDFPHRTRGKLAVEMSTTPALDVRGAVVACRAAFFDATERTRAEEERRLLLERERSARVEAEMASRAKDELLATVSHELRTPLAALLMWIEILRKSSDSSMRAKAIDALEAGARLQGKLIDDLIEVARAKGAGRTRLELGPADLRAIAASALVDAGPSAETRGVSLSLDDGPPVPVTADVARLRQVLDNLLSNAIKFTPEGGSVRVQVASGGAGPELRVEDSGDGIDPGFLPHVFEPFRQEDSSSTRVHEGLGLGLAIARELVEAHGGKIEAQSSGKGKGSTFVVTLLPADDTPTSLETPGPGEAVSLEGIAVLVVDDDARTSESVTAVLREHGAEVAAAGSVSEALRLLGQERWPDVVISDITMPRRDGYSLLRAIRAQDARRGAATPVAAVTARGSERDRRAVLEAGFQCHVLKPVEPRRLIALVSRLARGEGGFPKEPPEPLTDQAAHRAG